jgi:hypothetical protein
MAFDFFKCGLSALATVALSLPTARAGETLDEASFAAELSKMGCQVEIKMLAGSLTVERVETYKELSDDLFLRLKGLRQLVALDLRLPSEHSGSACLRGLVSLCTLRELALSGPDVNDQAAQYVGCLTNLESLKLHSVSLSEGGLLHLAYLKKLRHLELSNLKPITSQGLRAIATLTNLEEISIGGNCEKGALLVLKPLEKVATISVGGTHIDDQLAELRALPSVRTVKISRATITPTTAGSLLAMHNLESLDLGCCDIEPEAARQMQSLRLKRLDCYGADSKAYEQLLKALGSALWELHASSQN